VLFEYASTAAVLALAVDQLLALIEIRPSRTQPLARGARRHRHCGAGGGNPGTLDGALASELLVGARPFAEQYVLSR